MIHKIKIRKMIPNTSSVIFIALYGRSPCTSPVRAFTTT